MSTLPTRYLLDSDSFIRSKREHYAPDICPGYWDALLREFEHQRVLSIIPVRKELRKGRDALAEWTKKVAPEDFFASVEAESDQVSYAEVVQWVENHEQYTRAAKAEFSRGADPWLVAFAKSRQMTIVSYEVRTFGTSKAIKLPDVAAHFGLTCVPPYVMLRQLNVRLGLEK